MREAGEGSPPAGPTATTPRRPEERDGEALAGRGTTDRQAPPTVHFVSGMEHGPGPHGSPRVSSWASVTVAAGPASAPPAPLAEETSEMENTGGCPSVDAAATGAGGVEKMRLRAARAQSARCRKEWRTG